MTNALAKLEPHRLSKLSTAENDGMHFLSAVRLKGHPLKFEIMGEDRTALKLRPTILKLLPKIKSALAPATDDFIMGQLEALQSRYHTDEMPRDLSASAQLIWRAEKDRQDNEWMEDLGIYPPDLIKQACQNWRRNPKSRGFAPRDAGQLMSSVYLTWTKRKKALRNAQHVLDLTAKGRLR